MDSKLTGKLRCMGVLLQQLNAQEAATAARDAADEIECLRELIRDVIQADWRACENTLWQRLLAAIREQGANP